ncbi:hypothetical protein GCM10010517_31450 [Streptosporangium fragile]|uniref:Uncharacterized protein n=1 Tax=Streptosporangium fragile TaxID=46186 RepID=A0ABP6IG26_9ACTN
MTEREPYMTGPGERVTGGAAYGGPRGSRTARTPYPASRTAEAAG